LKTKSSDTAQMTHAKDSKDAKGYEKNPLGPLRPPREVESNSLFRRWHGPLTEELALQPGPSGLGKVPARLKPEVITRVVCGYCSTGCSLDVHLKDGAAVNLSPTGDYPVNLGMACPKGWEALAPLNAPDRAATPFIRGADGALQPANWDEAMRLFTTKFKNIMARHGNESVAFLSTGQICTEEMALLGALFKFGMGGIHCDSNTRQCMATAHVAYKQSFGFDAPPFTYADFEESDVLVFIGANPCIAHPIMWQRVLRNGNQPKILVIDPRRTETAMNATQHLTLNPKSDLILLYGVANLLAQNGWIAREFIERSTTGFDEFASFVRQFTPDKVAAETGLTVGEIYRLAEAIHLGKAVSFWWTMGINQSHEATRTAQAIINLALMTGNIGRPGTGANSITGQCNAMGSRLYSNITSLFGGRDFLNAEHREKVAELLNLPVETIPARNSWAYDQIVQGIADGKIKGLWVIATNPSHSWIARGSRRREEADRPSLRHRPPSHASGIENLELVFDKLDFLVVQDMYSTTETAQRAHLILPAAGWGEKEGTFINSERRIGLVKKVAHAPGQALSDFNIFRLVAHHWGCGEMFAAWNSPEAVFQILKRLSARQPCDITGIRDYEQLDAEGGIQWPWKEGNGAMELWSAGVAKKAVDLSPQHSVIPSFQHSTPPCERRLFTDGIFFHADGRAKFLFDPPRSVAEPTNAEYPFVLITGRGTSAQWHTNTRTGKSDVLRQLYPANAYLEINPSDAVRLGVQTNESVTVHSRRGRVECAVFITTAVRPGQVFIPMHYSIANELTRAEFDPHSRQPSYKHCAVRVEPASTIRSRAG
jgi:assimilatory nitrate reductase catalytic subunit